MAPEYRLIGKMASGVFTPEAASVQYYPACVYVVPGNGLDTVCT